MTEKRFKIYGDIIGDTYGILPPTVWSFQKMKRRYCDELNKLNDENEELKKLIKKVISERVVPYPLLQELEEIVKE